MISGAKNKEEVIITFLALLELIKQKMFTVDQDALFMDITKKKYTLSPTNALTPENGNEDNQQ